MDYLIYNLADPALGTHADPALLSEEECSAAARRGARYVLTRCLLRRELARRLDCAPQELRFRRGEQGKPECVDSPIHFNISHSGDCFAMAFDSAPIGIDVERVRPRRRLDALARRIMGDDQLAAFCERGCPVEEFYTCWCAAEALVKHAGSSIWQAKEKPFRYVHGRLILPEDSPLDLRAFTPLPGYAGAVAYSPPHPLT